MAVTQNLLQARLIRRIVTLTLTALDQELVEVSKCETIRRL